ncbi:MAG TPA: helix-turn-helix transcriptional regulator [Conexibacter sp.]|jgi:DNA-binding CsgD family transcriptional regulator
MLASTSAVLVREAVDRLGRSELELQELFHEVSARVRRVVPHDGSVWLTFDPDTLLPTSTLEWEQPPDMVRALWRNELLTNDLNGRAELVKMPVPVAALSQHDEAALESSERVQRILRPAGLGDELRAVLRVGGTTCGGFVLHRELGGGPFIAEERAFIADIARDVADGLRRSLVRRPATENAASVLVPGVATVTEDGELISTTAEARRLLRLMPSNNTTTLAGAAMESTRKREGARCRVRLPDGRWLLLHGAPLDGDGEHATDVAVTLLPAPIPDVTSLLLRLHGLTARERQVAERLMHGLTTDEIAARLYISPHTLRDHTKAVFQKVGVRSRSELMALAADPLAAATS